MREKINLSELEILYHKSKVNASDPIELWGIAFAASGQRNARI